MAVLLVTRGDGERPFASDEAHWLMAEIVRTETDGTKPWVASGVAARVKRAVLLPENFIVERGSYDSYSR